MDGDDFSECTTLDLQLGHVVESAVLRNVIDPQPVSRPALRSRTPRPAKEVDRDLFAATR